MSHGQAGRDTIDGVDSVQDIGILRSIIRPIAMIVNNTRYKIYFRGA